MSRAPENDFSKLVNSISASYSAESKIKHIDAGKLPNRDAIIGIIRLLRELLFPGYFGKQNLTSKTLDFHVGELLVSIYDELLAQVESVSDGKIDSRSLVREFLTKIQKLRSTLAKDVQAAFEGDPAAGNTDEIIFSYPGLFATMVYRLAHELHLLKIPLIPRIMTEYAHNLTGIDIHPGATIGEYFFIDHGTGVVIGETTIIGRYVKIYQGVTLGALSTRGGQKLRGVKRHPTLQDEVVVYSGASILGGETIVGKGAVISSNVFVTQSVPAGTRVTVKNPELQYRDQAPKEFKQETSSDWTI